MSVPSLGSLLIDETPHTVGECWCKTGNRACPVCGEEMHRQATRGDFAEKCDGWVTPWVHGPWSPSR